MPDSIDNHIACDKHCEFVIDYPSRWQFHKAMTLQEAKSIARHLGLTLRQVRSGAYRVNFRDGNETTAYYTTDLEDAVNTAVEMARKREVSA
jgi:hypothetical protein